MTDHTTPPQDEDPTSTAPADDDARERSSSIPPTDDDARERQTAPPGAGTQQGSASPPPLSQRPLLRRDHDKHLAGVAGGLADYLGVDATLIRVAFAALTIFGGIGIPLYLLGWVLLPSPSQPRSHAEQWFANAPNTAVVILVIVGFLIVLSAVTDGPGGNGIGWGLALLFGGWLLFRADSRASYAGTAPPAETNAAPQSAWHGAGGTAEHTAPAPAPWVPPPPRARSILGRLTVGLALTAVGVAALFEQLGVMDWQPVQYVALALTVTGVGLVVGAWTGRAYGLIGLGMALTIVLVVMSLGPVPIRSGVGQVSYAPQSLADVRDEYALGGGELALDLSDVDFGGTATEVAVSVGVGETVIVVPDEATVSVDAEMRAGVMHLFDTHTIGRPLLRPTSIVDEGLADGGRLQLEIDNGIGEITVRRDSEEL